MRPFSSLAILMLLFGACAPEGSKKQPSALLYFDLKGYISKEASRLKQLNPRISKTVMVNETAEEKNLKIADWTRELSAFSDADINKLAWQGLFKRHKERGAEVYVSDDDKVPVKSLRINYAAGKIAAVHLLISNANSLYTSNDTLSYYPDSLYQVRKTQHIILLKEKSYRITGKFGKGSKRSS